MGTVSCPVGIMNASQNVQRKETDAFMDVMAGMSLVFARNRPRRLIY